MPLFKGLTEDEALRISCHPQNFRTYLGKSLRGVISRNDQNQWFLLEQRLDVSWTSEILSSQYIAKHGCLIELSGLQIDKRAFGRPHFYGVPAGPLGFNHQFKTIFILGAGASFDCISSDSSSLPRLPLSNHIFKSDPFNLISEIYPAVFQKYSLLSFTENLERYFTQRWSRLELRTRKDELAELMNIQFFLHHLFLAYSNSYYGNRECNYRALIEKIHDYCSDTGEKVAVVSYNYDCIVDQAIESRYGIINTIKDYLASETKPISLIKPHGSCDWVRPIETKYNNQINNAYADRDANDIRLVNIARGIFKNQLSMADIEYITEDKLLLFHEVTKGTKYSLRNEKPENYKIQRCYWPNLLLPYNEKDEFVMPLFHTQHLDLILSQVEQIYIIGWKGEEQTMMNKFKSKIGARPIKVTVIDGPSNKSFILHEERIYTQLKKYLPTAEINIHKIGFSGYIRSIVDSPDFKID